MNKTLKKTLSIIIAILMIATTMPLAFAANGVSYIDENGKHQTYTGAYTEVKSDLTSWSNGWYVVNGAVTIESRITVSGTVNLVLADGAHLTASQGIAVNKGNTFVIYAQSTDEATMGKLTSTGDYRCAGIGGNEVTSSGTIVINGGIVSAKGGDGAAGIGGGSSGSAENITINGGMITAEYGSYKAAAIGTGARYPYYRVNANVTITGGTVIASPIGAYKDYNVSTTATCIVTGGNIKTYSFYESLSTGDANGSQSLKLYTFDLSGSIEYTEFQVDGKPAYFNLDNCTAIDGVYYLWLPTDFVQGDVYLDGVRYIYADGKYTDDCQFSNGICTICGAVCGKDIDHTGGKATCVELAVCDTCGNSYGSIDPNAHAPSEKWSYENGYHYYECLYGCGAIFDKSACSGSEATCLELAVCETCGNSYGEKNMNNHVSADTYYEFIDNNEHGLYNSCCGTLIEKGAHDDDAAAATCTGVAKCSVCKTGYGSVAENAHTGESEFVYVNTKDHQYKWNCCGMIEYTENHNMVYTADEDTDTISAVCSDCGANGTYTMNINSGTYNGYNFTASYSGTGIFEYSYYSLVKPTFDYCCDESCTKAGDHVATMTLGDATVSADFTIERRPLTFKEVQVLYKSYDGSTLLDLYRCRLDGVVIYSKGYYIDEDFDDVRDDVEVDTSLMKINAPDCVPGDYETVSVTNIKLIGEDADNYTIEESYDSIPVQDWVGYPGLTIEQPSIWIYAEDQVLEGDEELDQTAYEIIGLDEQFKIEGIELYEYGNRVEIDAENLTITLNDEDVTDYFNIETFSANLIKICEGHISDDYGFCSTGTCETYDMPYKVSEIDEYGDEVVLWYEIANAGQLYWYAKQVNDYGMQGTEAKLVNDIEIPATVSNGGTAPDWTPINYLYATFDGQGHSISGLYVDSEKDYVGLFGQHGYYDVKDLTIKESYFKGNRYVGAIAGYTEGAFKNCFVDSSVTVIGTESVGGLLGRNNGSNEVTNCMSLASVAGEYDVGGLIGNNYAAINNCYTTADSLVGLHNTYYNCEITNSYYLADEDTDDIDGTTAKTEEQFASGEVAYLLQSGIVEEEIYDEEGNYVESVTPHVWGQKIGTDDYPVLGGEKVYQYLNCVDVACYSNTELQDGSHTFENGTCKGCGQIGEAAGTHTAPATFDCTEGYTCTVCGQPVAAADYHTAPETFDCTEGYACIVCGQTMVEAVDSHTAPETFDCTEGYTCTVCGQPVAAADAHTGGTANCQEQAQCTVCGEFYGETNADNHKNVVTDAAVAATCTKTGLTEGSHCEACGEVITEQTVTDMLAHSGGTANCQEQAQCTTCGAPYGEIDANNHKNVVTDKAVAASCTETGLTEGSHCEACGEVIAEQTVTDMLAHKDDNGDYVCDYGCGREFEKPAEPDTPDEPADDTCDHICHSNNALMKVLWKIISFFQRLFGIQQYCDCGALHYEKAVFG